MKVDRKVKAEKRPPKAKTVKGNGRAAPKVSGKQLLAAYEHIPVGIVEASLDGKYMDVNAEFCRILGYSRRELLRRGIKDYTHEDDYGIDFKLHQDLIAGKIPFYRLEKRFVRKGGGIIWTELTRSLVCDEKGKPLHTMGVVLDISDRKDVESVLRDSVEQLRLATGAAQMFMWEWDFQNQSYILADNFEKVLGFSGGLLPKNSFETVWELSPKEDIQRISEEFEKAVADQRDLRVVPCRVINPENDQIVWLEISAKIVYDGEGNPERMFGVAQNITEDKKAEAALHLARDQAERSAERTARLQEVTAALSEALTPEQVAEVIVQKGAPVLGAVTSSMMLVDDDAQTLEVIYSSSPESIIRPYRRFSISLQVPAADAARAGEPVWMEAQQQYRERYPHLADEIRRWGHQAAIAIPMANQGRVLGVLTLSFDRVVARTREDEDYILTLAQQGAQAFERARSENALRESEERFRAIVSQATAGIAESDLDSRLVFANPGLCAMLGYSEEELLGKTIWELTYTDDLEENKRLFKRMLEEGKAYQFEKRFIRKDGSLLWASVSVTAIHDLAGNPKGSVGVVLDIQKRKQAELGLAEYARQQEALYQLSDWLHRTSSFEEIYNAGLDAILDALQCNRASILLFDDTDVMRFVAWRGLSDAYRKAVEGHSPWKRDAKDPQPVSMDDVRTAELDESLRRVIQGEGIGSLAFIPLVSNGALIGKFMVYFDMPHVFDEGDLDLSLTIARQLVFGIDRLRADEQLRQSEERFREIFETAGVSVWVEDFSEVSRALEALRAQGVQDLRAYFRENPEFVRRAIRMVRILDVNNETLDLFGATSKADLLQSLDKIFVPETEPSFIEELIALAEGREMVRMETTEQTLDGRRISVIFTVHFGPPGGDLRRVVVTLTDITARKQVEEALRESEQRYRAVVESQSEMLCRFQPDGTILFANGAYARARGTTPEALASRNFWEFIAEADRPFVRELLENLTPESPEVQIENRFQTVEGERWTLWTNRGLRFDASGRWLEAQSSGIDITERKQAEEALRASEERMRLATDAAGMFAWEFDIQNQSFTLSDNVAEVLGFSADFVSKSLDAVQSLNHSEPALIETVQRFSTAEDTSMIWEAMARAFEQQVDLRDLQYRLVDPESGQVVWVEVNARTIYDREGRPERMYGVSQNITERKRIEEALRIENERFLRFVDSNIVGILIGDASGNVIIANDYYLRLLGVTRREFEQGKVDWKQFTPPEWLAADEKAIQELRERGICEPYEKEYMRTDGRRVPVYIADAMLPGPGEEIAAFVVDITERKRAENALGIRARQQQAVAQLGELALRERDLQEVFNHATAAVAETLEVEYCNVLELMGGGVSLLLRAGVGWKEGLVGTAMVGTGLNSQAGFTLQSATPIIVDDLREERRFNGPPLLIDHGVISGMSCIIRGPGGLPWGVLGTHSSRRMSFTQDDVNFLVAIANILGDAIQREQVEDDLRASEERYRFIVENTSDGIWWIELTEPMPLSLSEDEQIDWYYKYAVIRQCNLGMARMYGYDSIEEVIGLPLRTVMPRENPVNLELSRQFVRLGYRLVDAESREIDRDGRVLVFLNNMVGIVDNGKLVGEWGTNRDITARKRAEEALRASEELYRAIARSIPGGGVYVVDKDLRYLVAEGPVTKAFGLSREMLEGRTVLEVFPNAAGERMVERLERNFAGETVSFETTFNGRFYWTQQAPLLDSIGHAIVVTLDITERKKAEEALRQSEEQFARFMQHLPGLAWIKDMEGRYVYANAAAEKAFNTPREKLYGRTDEDIFPSEVAAQFRRNDAQALTEEKGVQVIETLEHVDGVLHSSLVNKFPIPGPDGNTILIGGTAFDITERLGAEEALRESEERFRAILRQATAGIVRKDAEGRLVYVNEAFCNMLGYTESDLIGKTVWDFMHPDDIAESQRSYQRLMLEGIPFNLERRFLREDGSVIWVDASVSPIMDATGKPQSAVAVEVDVTGRKQAEDALRELNLQLEDRVLSRTARLRTVNQTLREEIAERKKIEEALRRSEAAARENEEKLRTLFDLLPVGISFLDPGGEVIQMNSALVSILKLSREEMGNQAYRSRTYIRANGTLMPPAEFASARALAEGKTIYGVETGIVLENGQVIWTSVSAAPVAVADVGALVVTVDITDSKRAERALQESRERLQILSQRLVEVQEEERRAIARELHDRVGQTLAALNINLLIVNSQLTDKVDEAISTRMQDSMKLVAETIALVRDVMSNLRPSVLDDYGLEAALQSHVEQYMSRYEIKVALDKPKPSLPRLGPSVEMTFLRIAQEALMNIAKHAQASEVRLSLRQEQDAIHMTIQDNGTGIQSWEMANRPGSHGMTIMRERAEAIGGNLKVTSIPGEGTMVDVSIPMENREQPRNHKESQR